MKNFNDRVYLLLTLKKSELKDYYIQTIAVILAVAAYNLIGVFLHTPIVVGYGSIVTALIVITLLYLYLAGNALPIDWDLLEAVEEEIKEEAKKPKAVVPPEEVQEVTPVEEEVAEVASNSEIQMVEVDENVFDFADSLASLYKTGTPKQLSEKAVNGIEQKVRRINIR